MTTIYQDYINDLKDSLSTPLLIEVQKKHINELKNNNSDFSDEVSYHNIYDKSLTHSNTSNVVVVNAVKGDNTQILNAFYEKTNVALKNKLGINSLVKAGVYFATMGLGELVSKDITNIASELLGDNLDKVTKVFDNDWINEQISKKVTEKPANIVTDAAEDIGNTQAEKFNEKHQFGSELFVSESAKVSLLALANNMSEYHTPHQAMQFTLKLITALGLDAPKLIVINNPFNLDSASLSLLSLLFSHAKDLKEKGQSTNISVLFNYTGPQPYDEPENTSELESEAYNTFIKLKRLRHMVQRYGMLEKPGSSIPTPAIKSTTFVGRVNEINDLTKAHASFIKFHQENKDRKKTSQWTLIKGEPGTGKTALINKHLANIDEKNDALSQSQIRLRQLNQVGHSSEVTGLASLLQSIQAEAERLTQYYQANQNFIQEKIADTSLAYKNSKADVKNLKNNRRGLFKLIKSATEFVVDAANLGTPYQAATSAINTLTLDNKKSQTGVALQQEGSTDKKQEQFDQLNMALRYLSNIAQVVDEQAAQMPILLFVDDLQWIDELTAEFILVHLLPAFPTELLFTARGSDSETSYKLVVEEQKHSPYKLALFDAVKLSSNHIKREIEQNTPAKNKLISLQPQIVIKGMDHETLSELIDLTYINSSEMQIDAIANAVINALSTEGITETTQVVTLFAIETLNLVSDPAFYQKNKLPTTLIIQPKKGVYEINSLEQQVLINTVENIFTLLRDAHTQAYTHDSMKNNNENHFTLSSYAVMEERLFLIGQYFNEYSDAAIFSLQLSALIGAPFDSELVRKLVSGLTNLNEEDYPRLTPIIELLKNNSQQALSPEHLEVLEEVFAILKRLQEGDTKYKYHHGLFAVFLRQQVKYRLDELFNYQENTDVVNDFFICCLELVFGFREKEVEDNFYSAHYGAALINYDESLASITQMALEIDCDIWKPIHFSSVSNLAKSHQKQNNFIVAIDLYSQVLPPIKDPALEYDSLSIDNIDNFINLSECYLKIGKLDMASLISRDCLKRSEELYHISNSENAQRYMLSLYSHANCLAALGNINDAIALYNKVEFLMVKVSSSNQNFEPTLKVLNLIGLADCLKKQNNKSLAIEMYRKSLDEIESFNLFHIPEAKNKCRLEIAFLNSSNESMDLVADTLIERSVIDDNLSGERDLERSSHSKIAQLKSEISMFLILKNWGETLRLSEEYLELLEIEIENDGSYYLEDYVNCLSTIGCCYFEMESFLKAIEYFNKNKELLEGVVEPQNDRWIVEHTKNLNRLATSYGMSGQLDNFITLNQECLTYIESFYNEKSEVWTELYLNCLLDVANSYIDIKQVKFAIKLYEQCIDILKKLYALEGERWLEIYIITLSSLLKCLNSLKRYDDATPLLQLRLELSEKYYVQQPSHQAKQYFSSIRDLSNNYEKLSEFEAAISLKKLCLGFSEKHYIEDKEAWYSEYTTSFYDLALTYGYSLNNQAEAIRLINQVLKVIEERYVQFPKEYAREFISNLSETAPIVNSYGDIQRAKSIAEQCLTIIRCFIAEHYIENEFCSYQEEIIDALDSLTEIPRMAQENLKVIEENQNEFPERWAGVYCKNLDKLADEYEEYNQNEKALICYKKLITLVKDNNNADFSNYSINLLRMLNRLKEHVAFDELALNHQSELKQYPNEAWVPHNQAWLLGVWGNSYHERGLINQTKEKISQMSLLITEHQLEDFEAFDELIQQYTI